MNDSHDSSARSPDHLYTSALDAVTNKAELVSPTSPSELIKSFQMLMVSSTPSAKTVLALSQIKTMVEGELDSASDRESESSSIKSSIKSLQGGVEEEDGEITFDTPTSRIALLVEHHPEMVETTNLQAIMADLELGSCSSRKYTWLNSNSSPYRFGGKTLQSRYIQGFDNISALLTRLNTEMDLHLNSCLITHYKSQETSLGWHQDNEDIFDHESPIVNLSLGSSRTIEFHDKNNATGSFFLQEGSILVMKKGCQEHLWHRVLPHSEESVQQTPRFCLSFRRVTAPPKITDFEKSVRKTPQKSPEVMTTQQPTTHTPTSPETPAIVAPPSDTPMKAPEPAAGVDSFFRGFHPSRIPLRPNGDTVEHQPMGHPLAEVPPLPTLQGYQPPPLRREAPPMNQVPPPPGLYNNKKSVPRRRDAPPQVPHPHLPQTKRSGPRHIIVGDSMVKGLPVGPEVLILSRGGGHPRDIMETLMESASLLPSESYADIETLALCVGTNALEWSERNHIPLLQVLSDYDTLVGQLREMFPRAVIGLCSVLPRKCINFHMNARIVDFNYFCRTHIAPAHKRVTWIDKSNNFLARDHKGDTFLIPKLYGRDFLHLSHEGKVLMLDILERAIFSYNLS